MTKSFIDVWDVNTFGEELLGILAGRSDLIRDYFTTENQILLSHHLASQRSYPCPSNQFYSRFSAFTESMIAVMEKRTIRAWHYTRLLDSEAATLRSHGVHLSTREALRIKLDALVALKELSRQQAEGLYAGSPVHQPLQESRLGKFWMTSHPTPVDSGDVTYLLSYWGGEVVTMLQDERHDIFRHLGKIGVPRVLEIGLPLSLTERADAAGEAVIATFGRTLGISPGQRTFDVFATSPMGPEAVLKIHTQGDATFAAIAQGYPANYVDVGPLRRKELGLDE